MVKNNIKEIVEKQVKEIPKGKKITASFTLSGATLIGLTEESKRLDLNKSSLVEMILSNYLKLPILSWDNKNQKNKEEDKRHLKNITD